MDILEYIKQYYSHLEPSSKELTQEILSRSLVYDHLIILEVTGSKEKANEEYPITEEQLDNYKKQIFFDLQDEHAKIILEKHKNLFINKCPFCGTIARTPVAQQGPCGHQWRDYELVTNENGEKVWILKSK